MILTAKRARQILAGRGMEWGEVSEVACHAAWDACRSLRLSFTGDDPGPWEQETEEERLKWRIRGQRVGLGEVTAAWQVYGLALNMWNGRDEALILEHWAKAGAWRVATALVEFQVYRMVWGVYLPEVHGNLRAVGQSATVAEMAAEQ